MPDISMCHGKTCVDGFKSNCYRYRAVPSDYRQSYLVDSPYDTVKKTCRYFWTIEPHDRIRNLNEIQG